MKTVAIIGASNDSRKFGNKAVRAFQQQGYTVYPVNPNETEGEGIEAFRRELQRYFRTVATRKPKASRPASREVYMLAKNYVL